MLAPGTTLLERYSIVDAIGEGGMATVYRANDQMGGLVVAVKEMKPTVEDAVKALQQFQQEAQLLSELDHPNIPQVHAYFDYNDHHYLVMDYVDGATLDHRIVSFETDRSGAPSVKQVLDWGLQVARALEYLHSLKPKPVIYKDLKPDNLMLTGQGKVMLLDFGIAKTRNLDGKYFTILKGMVSPGYAAPEQYAGIATDGRADIYSLGATMYALLAGNTPPEAIKRQEMFLRAGADPLPALNVVNEDVSPQLDAIVRKMLALKRVDRYQSAGEVVAALGLEAHGPAAAVDVPLQPAAAALSVSRWNRFLDWAKSTRDLLELRLRAFLKR